MCLLSKGGPWLLIFMYKRKSDSAWSCSQWTYTWAAQLLWGLQPVLAPGRLMLATPKTCLVWQVLLRPPLRSRYLWSCPSASPPGAATHNQRKCAGDDESLVHPSCPHPAFCACGEPAGWGCAGMQKLSFCLFLFFLKCQASK